MNNKISSLGGNAVSASSIPSLMAFSDDNKSVPASATATNYNTQLFATPSTNAEEIPEYLNLPKAMWNKEKIKSLRQRSL